MSGGSKPTRSSRSDDATRQTTRPPGRGEAGGGEDGGADPCDREFDATLTSVDMTLAPMLRTGERFRVVLQIEGNYKSVVCVRSNGDYVGAFAGITGLSQLTKCLREGRSFDATLNSVSGASVSVHVAPVR